MSVVAGRWRQTVCRAGHVRLTLASSDTGHRVESIEVEGTNGWETVLRAAGPELSTTFGASDGLGLQIDGSDGGPWRIELRGDCAAWRAEETITLDVDGTIRRRQRFEIHEQQRGAITPAWELVATPATRYTFPLRAFSVHPGALAERICADVAWALPLPGHLISTMAGSASMASIARRRLARSASTRRASSGGGRASACSSPRRPTSRRRPTPS